MKNLIAVALALLIGAACRWFETKVTREGLPGLVEQIARARAPMKH